MCAELNGNYLRRDVWLQRDVVNEMSEECETVCEMCVQRMKTKLEIT